ncbi:MAG: WD40 repeat domain-containing protein [Bacillota bacterium]
MINYYAALSIHADLSTSDYSQILSIEEQKWRLSLESPDPRQRVEAQEKLELIRQARRVLLDDAMRSEYDFHLIAYNRFTAGQGSLNTCMIAEIKGHRDSVLCAAFSPNGDTLASGSADKTIRVWRTEDGSLTRTITTPEPVYAIAFSPDGEFLAAGLKSRTIQFWRVADGALDRTLTPPPAPTQGWFAKAMASYSPESNYDILFTSDGRYLLSMSLTCRPILWDVVTGSIFREFDEQTSGPMALSNGILATVRNRSISFWRVSDGMKLGETKEGDDFAYCVAPHPSGEFWATGWSDGSVAFQALPDLEPRWLGARHDSAVRRVLFEPLGIALLTVDGNGKMAAWRVSDLEATGVSDAHRLAVSTLTLSPKGTTVATAGYDNTIKVFGLVY